MKNGWTVHSRRAVLCCVDRRLYLHWIDAGEETMKKLIFVLLLLPTLVLAEEKESCTIHDHGGGATIIACENYVITKTSEKTMICRLTQGTPNAFCTQVP